jgi:hypothetical protein
MIYLASPYSHPDKEVRHDRFVAACVYAGSLMQKNKHVYSPIAHTHPIAELCELPTGWEYWKEFDTIMLRVCSEVRVLCIPGWKESKGIAAELEMARGMGLPITYSEEGCE